MSKMDMLERPIAITDVETTGLDRDLHEIIEIGVVMVEQCSLNVLKTMNVKVMPVHPELITDGARAVNGFQLEDWGDAIPLYDAMEIYSEFTRDGIFSAHNVTFDWGFIEKAFRTTGIVNTLDYHRLDLLSISWTYLRDKGQKKFNLNEIAKALGIPEEPIPHRAINGAFKAYEVLRQLIRLYG